MMAQRTRLILGDVKAPVSLVKTSSESAGPRLESVQLDTTTGKPVIESTAVEFDTAALTAGKQIDEGVEVQVSDGGTAVAMTRGAAQPTVPHPRTGVAPIIPQNAEQAAMRDAAAGYVPTVRRARGVYTDFGKFVDLTELLEGIDAHVKLDGLTIAKAIPANVIPRDRVRGSFYIEPAQDENTPMALSVRVRDLLHYVLAEKNRALAVRWTKRTNQALGIIVASRTHNALMLLEVEWGPNMRGPSKRARVTTDFAPTAGELAAAEEFVARIEAPASAIDTLGDERRELQAAAIGQAKADGTLIELPERHSDDEQLAKALREVTL